MTDRTVIDEAADIIEGARRADYGPAEESFAGIAAFWSTYLGHPVTAHDVSQMMILMKVHRGQRRYHRDSMVDAIGYAALAEVIANAEERP